MTLLPLAFFAGFITIGLIAGFVTVGLIALIVTALLLHFSGEHQRHD